jgi:hypothetical protein
VPVFEKTGSQSKTGWDANNKTQTLKVGDTTEITLRNDATGGDAITIMRAFSELSVAVVGWGGISDDCTIHELPSEFTTSRKFVITALKQGAVEIQAGDHLGEWGSNVVAKIKVTVTESKRKPSLVFFPGEHSYTYTDGYRAGKQHQIVGTIYVVGGKGEKFRASGGPQVAYKDPDSGRMAEPTRPGHYVLGKKEHVTTQVWGGNSVIPWGADLRINRGEVEFKGEQGGWRIATGRNGEATEAEIAFRRAQGKTDSMDLILQDVRDSFIDPNSGKLTRTVWNLNPFGPLGWRLWRMPGHVITDQFIHTNPKDEWAVTQKSAVELDNSHGCIHIIPTDRKPMMDAGYLQEGVECEVRPYTEKGPPP